MRAVNRTSVAVPAMLLVLAALAACASLEPMTSAQVNDFEYGGYADSQERRDCVAEAEQVLASTGPSGDMYDETRKRLRRDFVNQCMKKRGR